MLGFSLQKLMVLAAVVAAVWYGFKWIGRLQAARDAEAGVTKRKSWWPGAARGSAKASEQATPEDMAPCRVCGTYVSARGARNCGRADCPY
jgi:hypothetical protein